MGAVNDVCVFLVILVNLQLIAGKPTFGRVFCALFCDEDDDYDYSSSTGLEDLLDAIFDPCIDCSTRRPPAVNPTTVTPGMRPPINFMLQPLNGMNMTMTNAGNSWYMNLVPWGAGAGIPGPPATPMPIVTTASPAAAAVTTASTAARNGTTAAGTATTTAATTKKP